jgi:hypothetical protein
MPFENCLPRVYSQESIERNAPASSGVYGLSNSHEWIYVGQTDNIRASLLAHFARSTAGSTHGGPTGFAFELVPYQARIGRQQALIVELSPSLQLREQGTRLHGR